MALNESRRAPTNAFALIDLLFITVFVGLLAILSASAVASVRQRNLSGECMGNQRELVTAWTLYAAENGDNLCNNFTIPDTLQTMTTGKFENWANNVMTWIGDGSTESQSTTNVDWVKRSVLAPYAADPVRMVKCPADNYLSLAQRRKNRGTRVRSYSMNAFMGRADTSSSSLSGRSWAEGGAYRQFLKSSDIPDPGKTWVTIEEHPDSINDGFFYVPANATAWGDLPGTFHNSGTTFSFADGHVELRKWRSRTVVLRINYALGNTRPFDALGRQDFQWYRERVGYVRFP
jgi:prepilin-type processing-associated H-X9-DG protein